MSSTNRRDRPQRVVLCVQNLSIPKDPRVWREARTLAANGFEVTVVSPRDQGQMRTELLEGVRVIRYGPPLSGRGVGGLVIETALGVVAIGWHVLRLRVRARIDVLHVANPPDVYFPLGLVMRCTGTKFIFDLHDPSSEVLRAKLGERKALNALVLWMERRSLRAANLVLTTNASFRQLAIRRGGLPGDRVVVVRTGPDGVAAKGPRDKKAPGRIVYAGVMGEQDGVDFLLRAVAEIRPRHRSVTLELIGDGPDVNRLRRLAGELGIADAVTWSGWLSRDEMRERLELGTIAVSPDADSELNRMASMLKIADYLAQGLATVASDLPETRITCGDAVLYVAPGDVTALAEGIARLLGDASLRDELSAAARSRAERLIWQPSGERLVGVYRWLLREGPTIDPDQTP